MSDFESSNTSSSGNGSSGNEADSEGEEVVSRRDMDDLIGMVEGFNPYMYEPERDISSTSSSSSESEISSSDTELNINTRIGNLEWCHCQKCREEEREIDCLCCQEVAALNSKFDAENMTCIIQSSEFETLCLNETVLKNVLTGLHVSRGDFLEDNTTNRSLRFAAYKQFVWWIFKNLGRGNRRVIPSCVIWKIRNKYPESNGQYTLCSDGNKD